MNVIEKKNLVKAQFDAEKAASSACKLLDSKFVEGYLSEKEILALENCTRFLTELEERFVKLYNDNEAWR